MRVEHVYGPGAKEIGFATRLPKIEPAEKAIEEYGPFMEKLATGYVRNHDLTLIDGPEVTVMYDDIIWMGDMGVGWWAVAK